MRLMLLYVLYASTALSQVSISLQPEDQALIPGSVRTLYANVSGTANLAVQWKATGACTLERTITKAEPERVTAPSRGATCRLSNSLGPGAPFRPPSNDQPSFSSAVSCRVTATSAADPTKSASIVLPICAPAAQLATFPASTVLFKGQYGVIQSDLRGSSDTGVTWALTTNPGGAGMLTGGIRNRHAVFSASAPGTYVITATSRADPRIKAASTLFVTAHDMPGPNPDHTEPVDCTAVGTGRTYEVGPAQQFHDLNSIAWNALKPGDTVRIHNDDTSGKAPTVYHQKISISATGSANHPIRICGVPDARGNKPVLDGAIASTAKDADWARGWLEDLGLILIYDAQHKFDTTPDTQRNILIEGLHLRNVKPAFHFVTQNAPGLKTYNQSAACLHVHTGREVMVRGNEFENCAQGIFVNSQTPTGSIVSDLTIEGNYFHDWGLTDNSLVHGIYVQAIGVTVQFNYFGTSTWGAKGNVIKSRSVMNFLRWNFVSQPVTSTARAFDLVEPQSYNCYVQPASFTRYHSRSPNDCNTPHDGVQADSFSPDLVASLYEAYHADYFYGNVLDDEGSETPFVHYGYDQQTESGAAYERRGGTLYYWNNTHLVRKPEGTKVVFDPGSPDQGHSYEFPAIVSVNNVFAANGKTRFQWVRELWAPVVVDSNWMKPGFLLPNGSSTDTYQGGLSAEEQSGCSFYGRCREGNGHMRWERSGKPGSTEATLYRGATPFDPQTFQPGGQLRGLSAPLPAGISDQPSNMEFVPATGKIKPRQDQTVLGALD